MTLSKTVTAALLLLCAPGVSGFVQSNGAPKSAYTSLQMSKQEDGMKKVVTSFAAAAFLAANLMTVAPAFATDQPDFFGTTQVIAGRSGGRAGGRSSGGRSSYRAPPRTTISNTRVIQRTYMAPPVMMAPSYGYGYNPMGGLGKQCQVSTKIVLSWIFI
jgi:uncharacterized membrane protein